MISYFFIFSIIFNIFLIFFFRKISNLIGLFDKPDSVRKFHTGKVSAIGGFLIFVNLFFLILFLLVFNENFHINLMFNSLKNFFVFIIFASLFFLLGFLDDKYVISSNYKIIIFSLLIFFLVFLDKDLLIKNINFSFYPKIIDISSISIFFTILCFLLFINAFNMFDGVNLQSAFYSLFIFFIFFVNGIFFYISITIIISLIFFSYLNYKNKCFMGDNGSLLISFIISYIFISTANSQNFFFADEIFLIMLIPGLDLFRLCIFRVTQNKHPFLADRDHIHHRLLDKFGFNNTLLILFILIVPINIISLIYGYTFYLILLSIVFYIITLIVSSNKFLVKK
jgi:UDP-GlcNAc:undecaprenyl-phosphate GlcNAc-1-phosphate transferase